MKLSDKVIAHRDIFEDIGGRSQSREILKTCAHGEMGARSGAHAVMAGPGIA